MSTNTEHAVVIAGGGPTGLMLAGELALAGVDVAIVERRAGRDLDGSRAGGLHSRSIEILDQRGIADRFLSEGYTSQSVGFAWLPLDIADFPTRHNYVLALRQKHIERILADWVNELAVRIYRAREVTGLAQDDTGINVALSNGEVLRAEYLVGCDGGRSVVRKASGIEFLGWDATTSSLIAEAQFAEEPAWGKRDDARGAIGKLEDGRAGIMVVERRVGARGEPTLRDLSDTLSTVYGTDYGVHSATSISRFTDTARQAATYRKGRVLLAGDSAHVHSPVGGQGLNIGLQDAANLGWKLASVVKRMTPETLLDTYHAERYPIAARVLQNNMAQVALLRDVDDRLKALRDTLSEILTMDEPRKRLAAMMSGLDVRYDFGNGHPLLGRRMPDLDLATMKGSLRVFSLLHDARPVLINFGNARALGIGKWTDDRVRFVDAQYAGTWELPEIGVVAAPEAALIRPDGYVAWVGDESQAGLVEALTFWFG